MNNIRKIFTEKSGMSPKKALAWIAAAQIAALGTLHYAPTTPDRHIEGWPFASSFARPNGYDWAEMVSNVDVAYLRNKRFEAEYSTYGNAKISVHKELIDAEQKLQKRLILEAPEAYYTWLSYNATLATSYEDKSTDERQKLIDSAERKAAFLNECREEVGDLTTADAPQKIIACTQHRDMLDHRSTYVLTGITATFGLLPPLFGAVATRRRRQEEKANENKRQQKLDIEKRIFEAGMQGLRDILKPRNTN